MVFNKIETFKFHFNAIYQFTIKKYAYPNGGEWKKIHLQDFCLDRIVYQMSLGTCVQNFMICALYPSIFRFNSPHYIAIYQFRKNDFKIPENKDQFAENFMLIQKMYNIWSKIKEKLSYYRNKLYYVRGFS